MSYKDFADFLFHKHLEYQLRLGRKVSLQEFADYLGVSHSNLSQWTNRIGKPSAPKALTIAKVLGPEVYDFLDLKADLELISLRQIWDELNSEGKRFVRECAEKYLESQQFNGEDAEKLTEIMKRWASERGYTVRELKISQGKRHDQKAKP